MNKQFTPTILEAASWRLASQLVRRHPDELNVWRLHPGGGQYDVLGIRSEQGLSVDLNRRGRIHFHKRQDGGPVTEGPVEWMEYLTAPDPRGFIKYVEAAAGLPETVGTPTTTSVSLVFRVISSLAAAAVLAEPWDITMGRIDTSGGMGPTDANWWRDFAPIAGELAHPSPGDPLGEAGFRFWRCERSDVVLTFEVANAIAWSAAGHRIDLMDAYQRSGRALGVLMGELWRAGAR
jgi:hypothetical protein